jgi:hypothetical protein
MFLLFGLFVTGIQNPIIRSSQPVPSTINLHGQEKLCLQKCHFTAHTLMLMPFQRQEDAILIAYP